MNPLPPANNAEEAIPEGQAEMPVLQGMINDLHESTALFAQTSNTSSPSEDRLVDQAIAFSAHTESDEDTTASGTSEDAKATESLDDVLNSSGKCLSIVLNNPPTSTVSDLPASGPDYASLQSTAGQQVNSVQQVTVPSTGPITTAVTTSTKKPHIMISYNRSCQEMCDRIRHRLKTLKYIVWMDIYDMRSNFIEGMAKAISNSYIVLMCLNSRYDRSPWCRKEAESISIKQINFIPCFMEEPYTPADWVALLLGANIRVDFSNTNQFEDSFQDLLKQISFIEEELATNPRESPPVTPSINPATSVTLTTTAEAFDAIFRDFKTWVEQNRNNLKRSHRQQSAQLIRELVRGLESDPGAPDDENKRELLQQLLSVTSQNHTDLLPRLINSLTSSNSLVIKGLLFIMALWAVQIVFRRD